MSRGSARRLVLKRFGFGKYFVPIKQHEGRGRPLQAPAAAHGIARAARLDAQCASAPLDAAASPSWGGARVESAGSRRWRLRLFPRLRRCFCS
jgi:hypothetical protein